MSHPEEAHGLRAIGHSDHENRPGSYRTGGLVYATDRVSGGVYILEPAPELAARMREAQL